MLNISNLYMTRLNTTNHFFFHCLYDKIDILQSVHSGPELLPESEIENILKCIEYMQYTRTGK